MLLCADAEAASADLASGGLACPSCGDGGCARAGRAGSGSRTGGGARQRVRPRRGLCGSCGATHLLLPSWMAQARGRRRRDSAGGRRLGALRGRHGVAGRAAVVPAATVRGWLRRLSARQGHAP